MAVITMPSRSRSAVRIPSVPKPSMAMVAFVASTIFLGLWADAILNEHAFFDVWGLQQAQRFDGPAVGQVFTWVNALTDGHGAVIAWGSLLAACVAARWWVPALAVGLLPAGGALNYVVGALSAHERPAGDEFVRTVVTSAASFPSGHVMGAVMLYGFVFVLAGRLENGVLRAAIRVMSVGVLVLVGPARLWEGAHWPSDVAGAYALGALVLAAVLVVYGRMNAAWGGLPLIKQGRIPHDMMARHAHALTSVVTFKGETVTKVYSPGLLPRLLYRISFQAPFPYIANREALDAAVARRNLASQLTAYWYGTSRVAKALGIDEVGLALGIRSELVHGHEPADPKAAKAFLDSLRRDFEAAGFPTWQIDPRQPRSGGNVLETADGQFMVVDLESGLVSLVASPRVIWRAIRAGRFPIFDDVDTARTRDYLRVHELAIRTGLGHRAYTDMLDTLATLEAHQDAWHAAEPRLLGRFLGGFRGGWNYRAWPERFSRVTGRGAAKATAWMTKAADAWEREGRLSPSEASQLRGQIESPAIKAAMPHFGAHGTITVFLRFPFGSIARPLWSIGALSVETVRLATRRTSLGQWKRSWSMHSPLVIALSVVPGFGAMAYLAAKPVRQNRLLVRAVVDQLALKVPGRMYERSGLRSLVAKPAMTSRQPEADMSLAA
ncbi:MAG: phosphatase PAP2 family protein [Dehalococcoidia bacterium]